MQEPFNLRDAKLKKKPSPFAEPTPDKEEEVKRDRPYKKAVLADDGTMKQVRELASASSPPASAAGAVAAVAAAADEEPANLEARYFLTEEA